MHFYQKCLRLRIYIKLSSFVVPIMKSYGKQLQRLDLYDCHITRTSPFALGFSKFEELRHLSIGRNPGSFSTFLNMCVSNQMLSLNLVGFTHEANRPSTHQINYVRSVGLRLLKFSLLTYVACAAHTAYDIFFHMNRVHHIFVGDCIVVIEILKFLRAY